jgi:MFS family permease
VSGYIRLLRTHPDFARLWLAQVISLFGDWFNTIVLLALVARYSDEQTKGLAVSGFLLARLVPPLLVSPFAGVLVDRFDRKRLLIFSDVLRAGVVLLLLVANAPDRLWLIYVLTIVQFTLSAIFEPGRSAITPSLIPHDELVAANTLSSVTWSVMLAVGAMVGGVVADLFGTSTALVIDALSFALSAVLITQIRIPQQGPTVHSVKPVQDRTFMDGLRYVARHPETAVTLLVKLGQSLGNVDALVTIYATEVFVLGKDGTTSLSILFASFGIGAVLGPLMLNRFNDGSVRTLRRLIAVGFVWIVLAWLLMSGAASLWVVALALVIRAMGGSVNWTYSSVIIQKSTANEYLGRMFSLDMAGFQFASIISILVTGILVDTIGTPNIQQIVLLMAVVSMIPLLLWLLTLVWLEKRSAVPVSIGD